MGEIRSDEPSLRPFRWGWRNDARLLWYNLVKVHFDNARWWFHPRRDRSLPMICFGPQPLATGEDGG